MAAGPHALGDGYGPLGPSLLRNRATLASYRILLRNRSYRLWFLAALTSSLGDWAGLFALQILVTSVAQGPRLQLFSLGGIMMARLLPSLIVGPVAGVLADRYERRRLMVMVDLARGVLFCVMAFSGDLVALFALTLIIETLALMFLSAKDAMLPSLIDRRSLTQANQLNFLVTYGTLPLGAMLAFAMTGVVSLLASVGLEGLQPAPTVLVINALTFFVAAALVSRIPEARDGLVRVPEEHEEPDSEHEGLLGEVREGLRAIADEPLVYALITGVVGVFFGAGIIVSLGPVFVSTSLGRPDADWFTLLTAVGSGLLVGIISVPLLTNRFRTERVYPVGLVIAAALATAIALISMWAATLALGAVLGATAGLSFVTGFTLLHAYTSDENRGRTFAAFYTGTRVTMFAALGLAPFLAGSIEVINIGISGTGPGDEAELVLSGTRITMLAGGVVALWFAQRSARAMWRASRVDERPGVRLPKHHGRGDSGLLIAFEGVEGAGKSTQAEALSQALKAVGYDVVSTREPGGTPAAEAVRAVLLDPRLKQMGDRTEALLYAAARADHVDHVIQPALEAGKIVISDRFLDSSLAYQGHARQLGVDEVTEINRWATGGLVPDLVVLLRLEPSAGMERVLRRAKAERLGRDDRTDRIESEELDFHLQVAFGYMELARRHAERFVVIDADAPPEEVARRVRNALEPWLAWLVVEKESP